MEFPDKEEAVRYFTDVKQTVETTPEMFTYPGFVSRFTNKMLEALSGEWKTLENVPEDFYEINIDGHIRHKVTQEIIEPTLEPRVGRHVVKIRMAGETYYFHGPELAKDMFDSVSP